MVRVKICGITNLKDALLAVDAGADAVGFVFAESPRRITPDEARKISLALPPFICRVGVFVDEEIKRVKEIASFCKLGILQFHGSESSDYCSSFEQKVIKSFRIRDFSDLEKLSEYKVGAFLLDAYEEGKLGGTGKVFNWEIAVKAKKYGTPIILSGGLKPENVLEAIKFVQPYAVDASSGVEIRPGGKDSNKMREFIKKVKG